MSILLKRLQRMLDRLRWVCFQRQRDSKSFVLCPKWRFHRFCNNHCKEQLPSRAIGWLIHLWLMIVLRIVEAQKQFAVCCSVLQCVAVCCSVLQCVAVCFCASWRRRNPAAILHDRVLRHQVLQHHTAIAEHPNFSGFQPWRGIARTNLFDCLSVSQKCAWMHTYLGTVANWLRVFCPTKVKNDAWGRHVTASCGRAQAVDDVLV